MTGKEQKKKRERNDRLSVAAHHALARSAPDAREAAAPVAGNEPARSGLDWTQPARAGFPVPPSLSALPSPALGSCFPAGPAHARRHVRAAPPAPGLGCWAGLGRAELNPQAQLQAPWLPGLGRAPWRWSATEPPRLGSTSYLLSLCKLDNKHTSLAFGGVVLFCFAVVFFSFSLLFLFNGSQGNFLFPEQIGQF